MRDTNNLFEAVCQGANSTGERLKRMTHWLSSPGGTAPLTAQSLEDELGPSTESESAPSTDPTDPTYRPGARAVFKKMAKKKRKDHP